MSKKIELSENKHEFLRCPFCEKSKIHDIHGHYRERNVIRTYIRVSTIPNRKFIGFGYYCITCKIFFDNDGIPSKAGNL